MLLRLVPHSLRDSLSSLLPPSLSFAMVCCCMSVLEYLNTCIVVVIILHLNLDDIIFTAFHSLCAQGSRWCSEYFFPIINYSSTRNILIWLWWWHNRKYRMHYNTIECVRFYPCWSASYEWAMSISYTYSISITIYDMNIWMSVWFYAAQTHTENGCYRYYLWINKVEWKYASGW